MKKNEIEVDAIYAVAVSGKVAPVKILRECESGGWIGKNMHTERQVRIRSAQKCRYQMTLQMHPQVRYVRKGTALDSKSEVVDRRQLLLKRLVAIEKKYSLGVSVSEQERQTAEALCRELYGDPTKEYQAAPSPSKRHGAPYYKIAQVGITYAQLLDLAAQWERHLLSYPEDKDAALTLCTEDCNAGTIGLSIDHREDGSVFAGIPELPILTVENSGDGEHVFLPSSL